MMYLLTGSSIMKTPRVHDFDPNAKIPQLGTPMEHFPVIQKPAPPVTPKEALPERSNARTGERLNGKRIITRNSFEIYEDQMESLRKLSFRDKMEGKLGSMSAMVREAIDTYLKKRTSES